MRYKVEGIQHPLAIKTEGMLSKESVYRLLTSAYAKSREYNFIPNPNSPRIKNSIYYFELTKVDPRTKAWSFYEISWVPNEKPVNVVNLAIAQGQGRRPLADNDIVQIKAFLTQEFARLEKELPKLPAQR